MWSGVGMVSDDVPGGGGGATPDDKHLIHLHWKISKKYGNLVRLHVMVLKHLLHHHNVLVLHFISTLYTSTRKITKKHLYLIGVVYLGEVLHPSIGTLYTSTGKTVEKYKFECH